MKLFVLASDLPVSRCTTADQSAANVILWSVLTAWRDKGHEIVLQLIIPDGAKPQMPLGDIAKIESLGIRFLPVLEGRPAKRPDGFFARVRRRFFEAERFYPSLSLRPPVEGRIRASGADAAVAIFCPDGIAAMDGMKWIPRIAYLGDVEPVVFKARQKADDIFGNAGGPLSRLFGALDAWAYERHHLRLMLGLDALSNNAEWNAAYYREHGHRHSSYVGNVWMPAPSPAPVADGKKRVIGHFGYMNRTGSSFGLRFLTRDVIPALEKEMAGKDFEVLVIGEGEPAPALRDALKHPRIRRIGFVDQIEPVLSSADAYMMLNNAGGYAAAYTRHMVAWSMGLCLIVHENSRKAIPEIVPEENALVGATGEAVATAARRAMTDPALNARIRQAGRETYLKHFTPEAVAGKIMTDVHNAVERRRSTNKVKENS